MNSRRLICVFSFLAIVACVARSHADGVAGRLFWSNNDRIQTANIDGTDVIDLVATGINKAADVEIDLVNQRVYWTDIVNDSIKRANLDGSGVESLFGAFDLNDPISLELDVVNGHMYWGDRSEHAIYRADLDGSNRVTILSELDVLGIYQFDLDLINNHIYWATTSSEIRRANFDGTDVQTVANTSDSTYGIVLDVANDRLFWTETNQGKLWTAGLDGTGATELFDFDDTTRPLDMEFDPTTEQLYIADNQGTRIWRASSDGIDVSPIIDLPDPPLANLLGLAVVPVPEPGSFWMLAISGVCVLRRRRG